MKRSRPNIALVLGASMAIVAALAPHALGIVRNDETVGDTANFPFAVKIGDASGSFCSGTIIGGGKYAITAAHCMIAGDDATDYRAEQDDGTTLAGVGSVITHPTLDIAIIELGGAFSSSVGVYSGSDEAGREIAFGGFGLSSSSADGFGGPGTGQSEDPYGTLRIGYNIVDYVDPDFLGFDFDLAGGADDGTGLGDREATTFTGDSGMGYFLETMPGQYALAGIHSGIFTPPHVNRDGTFSFGVRVSSASDWINEQIPAPQPASLAILCVGAAARRRRPTRHRPRQEAMRTGLPRRSRSR